MWVQAEPQLENGVYWYVTDKAFGFTSHRIVFLDDQDMAEDQCEDRLG